MPSPYKPEGSQGLGTRNLSAQGARVKVRFPAGVRTFGQAQGLSTHGDAAATTTGSKPSAPASKPAQPTSRKPRRPLAAPQSPAQCANCNWPTMQVRNFHEHYWESRRALTVPLVAARASRPRPSADKVTPRERGSCVHRARGHGERCPYLSRLLDPLEIEAYNRAINVSGTVFR